MRTSPHVDPAFSAGCKPSKECRQRGLLPISFLGGKFCYQALNERHSRAPACQYNTNLLTTLSHLHSAKILLVPEIFDRQGTIKMSSLPFYTAATMWRSLGNVKTHIIALAHAHVYIFF